MARFSRSARRRGALLGASLGLALALALLLRALGPAAPGARPRYVRFDGPIRLSKVLDGLARDGLLRSAPAARLLAILERRDPVVKVGTYRVGGGMSARALLGSLASPVRRQVRIPAQEWAAGAARLLARRDVCSEVAYLDAVRDPSRFAGAVPFPLPADSLEGYLYPDTYDLPPLLGAAAVVERQLRAFDQKVFEPLGRPAGLQRLLIVASLVELEVSRDDERPLVAAVIENRLKAKMPLQIDASVNYALGVWRALKPGETRTAPGPYNLYTHRGLPPGPICSPSLKSVEAALRPARVDYLYYVAMPSGRSLFAATYPEHLANVAKRRAALRAREPK